MKSIVTTHFVALSAVLLLAGCIDLDSSSSDSLGKASSGNLNIAAENVEEIAVTAAGIKGPLAFADAIRIHRSHLRSAVSSLGSMDFRFPEIASPHTFSP